MYEACPVIGIAAVVLPHLPRLARSCLPSIRVLTCLMMCTEMAPFPCAFMRPGRSRCRPVLFGSLEQFHQSLHRPFTLLLNYSNSYYYLIVSTAAVSTYHATGDSPCALDRSLTALQHLCAHPSARPPSAQSSAACTAGLTSRTPGRSPPLWSSLGEMGRSCRTLVVQVRGVESRLHHGLKRACLQGTQGGWRQHRSMMGVRQQPSRRYKAGKQQVDCTTARPSRIGRRVI